MKYIIAFVKEGIKDKSYILRNIMEKLFKELNYRKENLFEHHFHFNISLIINRNILKHIQINTLQCN